MWNMIQKPGQRQNFFKPWKKKVVSNEDLKKLVENSSLKGTRGEGFLLNNLLTRKSPRTSRKPLTRQFESLTEADKALMEYMFNVEALTTGGVSLEWDQ